MKYAAVFAMTSWKGLEEFICVGSSAEQLLREFENIQSLGCLVRMGRREEDSAGQKQLDKLEKLLDSYYSGDLTNEQLLTLDLDISLGTIKCLDIMEGEDAVEKIKAKFPNAKY